ncbi:MAG: hypothetical protein Fur0041_07320 [Bacteroidia bacterium]
MRENGLNVVIFIHMKMVFKLLFPILMLAQILHAQKPDMSHYKPAESRGPIPKDFLISTIDRYQQAKKGIDENQNKELQKAEEQFYLQTSYQVDQIRYSGSVLVNDTMCMYVNMVADSLLAHEPELRGKIHIYILRSPVVNAFATDQGAIFVTVGLLTRLHNEAELAYVLAHEIIHYKRRHVLSGYIEGVKMQEGLGQYEAMTFENRFLKKHRYARSQESQADDEGFELLVKSNYDPHAAITAFDILAMADFPFSDTAFSKTFFETPFLYFPAKYQPDTIKPLKIDEDERENDFATHPSVTKRKKTMIKKFRKLTDTTGAYFLVSTDLFYKVKTIARFEECLLHTNEASYFDAIYSNYTMQKIYPNNFYLEKEMVRTMYAIALEKNRAFSFENLQELFQSLMTVGSVDEEKPLGEQGRMRAFVNKVDAKGWNVAALQYAWMIHNKYPSDRDIELWCHALFKELTVKNELRPKDFQQNDSLYLKLGERASMDTSIVRKMKGNDAYARFHAAIDYLSKDSLGEYKYWQFALINEMKDSSFVKLFREAAVYADSIELTDSLYYEKSSRDRKKIRRDKDAMVTGPQGLTKVVAVNPIYIAYDYTLEQSPVDVMNSFNGRKNLISEMQYSASKCNLNLVILDPQNMDTGSVGLFNDLMIINDWFDHRTEFKGNVVLPFSQQKLDTLCAKYGTSYFMWNACFAYKSKRTGVFWRALTVAFLPIAPHAIYKLSTKREDLYLLTIVYDFKTGKAVYVQRTEIDKQKVTRERVRLHIYDMINQLSSPKKK